MPLQVYQYSMEDVDGLLKLLAPSLPLGLSLYRRAQLCKTKKQEMGLFATFPPKCSSSDLPKIYTIGVLTRSAPGVQAWLYSSLETLISHPTSPPSTATRQTALDQLLAILAAFRSHSLHITSSPQDPPNSEDMILIGTVNSDIAALLRAHATTQTPGLVRDDVYGPGGPYGRYAYRTPLATSHGEKRDSLPSGLRFDAITDADHGPIIASNSIVRNAANLLYLPHGVGVRSEETGTLVAWAFLGVDGCVRTLHVAPEMRRLGLGRKVALRVWEEGMAAFGVGDGGEGGQAWACADADATNAGSVRLFKGLGARWCQDSFWMLVDLAAVPAHEGIER